MEGFFPGLEVDLLPIVTSGDRRQEWSLQKAGGKGLFTLELEEALRCGDADLAVHSAKDLPVDLPEDLGLCAFLPRESPLDVLILREGVESPRRIASGSPRRRAQVSTLFPEAEWTEMRGNVGTRLSRVAAGEGGMEATLLAAAGMRRLGLDGYPGLRLMTLPREVCVPAAGQGAIALQARSAESAYWERLGCEETARAVLLERAVLGALGGGCQIAAGVHCEGDRLLVFHERFGRLVWDLPKRSPVETREAAREWVKRQIEAAL